MHDLWEVLLQILGEGDKVLLRKTKKKKHTHTHTHTHTKKIGQRNKNSVEFFAVTLTPGVGGLGKTFSRSSARATKYTSLIRKHPPP